MDQNSEIIRRLEKLEHHVINLILPIQDICSFLHDKKNRDEFLQVLKNLDKTPLKINETPFIRLSSTIEELRKELKIIENVTDNLDIKQTYSEIKYIGNRLLNIENKLKELHFDDDMEDSNINVGLENLLNTLLPKERIAVIHRLGLMNQEKNSFQGLAKYLNIKTASRARIIYAKALRKLAHISRKHLLMCCDNVTLKDEVMNFVKKWENS